MAHPAGASWLLQYYDVCGTYLCFFGCGVVSSWRTARVRSKNRNGSLPAKFLVHIIMMSQHNNRQSPSKQATRPNTPLQSHRSHLLFLPIIIASVMLIFGITKLINKTLAPKLLSLGLRLHDISPSSSSSGLIMPLLLPLAQKLVSTEVRDDYRNLARSMMTMMQGEDGGGGGRGGGGEKNNRVGRFRRRGVGHPPRRGSERRSSRRSSAVAAERGGAGGVPRRRGGGSSSSSAARGRRRVAPPRDA